MTETSKDVMHQALSALDLAQARLEKSRHRGTVLSAYTSLREALVETAPVQEPVAWWKQYPDGSISVVESRTFLAEDAVAMGWRALGFTDVAPQAQQSAPPADVPMLTDDELTAIYKQANGEDVGKAQPLTTQRIFKAMRATARVHQKVGLLPRMVRNCV